MEKFIIKERIALEGRNLYLLNMPFEDRKKEEDFYKTEGRMSSYHQSDFNEPNWLVYSAPFQKGEVCIVASLEKYTDLEALAFSGMNNGLCLTRDNLFMLPSLCKEHLFGFKDIHAFMPEQYLPEHLNGPKICPLLSVKDRTFPHEQLKVDYDWSHTSKRKNCSFGIRDQFVFFVPTVHKSYR